MDRSYDLKPTKFITRKMCYVTMDWKWTCEKGCCAGPPIYETSFLRTLYPPYTNVTKCPMDKQEILWSIFASNNYEVKFFLMWREKINKNRPVNIWFHIVVDQLDSIWRICQQQGSVTISCEWLDSKYFQLFVATIWLCHENVKAAIVST